jgi:prolyl-tRNA synthetase
MRLSQLFGRTLRDAPTDAETISHQLVVRAGLARPLASGVWSYLPLGWRVVERVAAIVRAEMSAIGGQEMHVPGHEGMHKAIALLARQEVESYRQLPRLVYQIQTRLSDETQPRGGLIRLREYRVAQACSLHADAADLDAHYPQIHQACLNVFRCCGLEAIPVEAGPDGHLFMLPGAVGEDRFVRCPACDYAASLDAATFRRDKRPAEAAQPVNEVATPGADTIAKLAAFLDIGTEATLKVMLYTADERDLVMALVRGDLDVSQAKLRRALQAESLRPATEDEVAQAGLTPGYIGPVDLTIRKRPDDATGLLVVADLTAQTDVNFVTGANRHGYHLNGVRHGRDFRATLTADIAEAADGSACSRCDGRLQIEPAIELGRCSKIGTRYSQAAGTTYLDADGKTQPVAIGTCSIGLDRLIAATIEVHHDEHGIVWPLEVAPYPVHVVALGEGKEIVNAADDLVAGLEAHGVEPLYDDRPGESAGVKFADADLIGAPLRVTVSKRSLQAGGVETKWRAEEEREVIPTDGAAQHIADALRAQPGRV